MSTLNSTLPAHGGTVHFAVPQGLREALKKLVVASLLLAVFAVSLLYFRTDVTRLPPGLVDTASSTASAVANPANEAWTVVPFHQRYSLRGLEFSDPVEAF